MSYQMELTDQQWFNLICGMNAGLAMKYKKAPFSELTKVEAPPGKTPEQAAALYKGNFVTVWAMPEVWDFTQAFNDVSNPDVTLDLYGTLKETLDYNNRLEISVNPESEYREEIIKSSNIRSFFTNYKEGRRVLKRLNITQESFMRNCIYGLEYVGSYDVTKTVHQMYNDTEYIVTAEARIMTAWDPIIGKSNCCIFGGGYNNTAPVYARWIIGVQIPESPGTFENFDMELYLGETGSDVRIAKKAFYGANSEFVPSIQGLIYETEPNICGVKLSGTNLSVTPGTHNVIELGELRFGPLYAQDVSSQYMMQAYSFLMPYLMVNNTIYYEHRPNRVYYADDSYGQLQNFDGIATANQVDNCWGFISIGTVMTGQVPREYGQNQGKATGNVAEVSAASKAKSETYFVEKQNSGALSQANEDDEDNLVWSVGGEATDKDVQREFNQAINESGFVQYEGYIKVDKDKTLYFYVADKVTGEQLTPSVPVQLTAGENHVNIKIPLVSEQTIAGEYYITYTEYVSYSNEYDSLEEAVAAGDVDYNLDENKPKPYNTTVTQAGPGAPALPVRPIGEDKIKINERLLVVVTEDEVPVDTTVDDTITVDDEIEVTEYTPFDGNLEEEETVSVSDDIDVVQRTEFNGTVSVTETTSLTDEVNPSTE